MAKIKICGLRREQDIGYVNKVNPDYVGFIMSKGYKRSVADADGLKSHLSKKIKAVGVFVDEPLYEIEHAISCKVIDIVQLHGKETPEYCSKINAPVIKTLMPDDFDKVKAYEPYVDYFLFDSGTGTGKTFDWCKIPKTEKPFFLAGGLSADNLEEAIGKVNPFAVDLSSAVETDGFKDYEKIKKVIEITRRTENE